MPKVTIYQKIWGNLRVRLSFFLILIALISTTLVSFLDFHELYLPLFPIPIVSSLLLSILIWISLKPLEELVRSSRLFARGEFAHRVNLHSRDEVGEIAIEFNFMAQNLEQLIKNIQNDKSILDLEKNKLNLIISSITDGIIVLNLHRQVVLANKAAERLTDFIFDEMKGKNIDQLIKMVNKDGAEVPCQTYCPLALVDGSTITSFNSLEVLNLIGKGGTSHSIKLHSSAINSQITTDLGCILTLQDQSREKELESIQLDFVSMASHELRTPLTSIVGYLSVFMEENRDKLNLKQKDFLNRILISSKQLQTIIDNLLSVSKVERGALGLSIGLSDWKQILNQAIENNQIQATEKNISLKLELPPENLPKVSVDTVRINEVLNNLISNAINYTGGGGVITVSCKLQGPEIITSVADTGPGIPQQALPHLFTKFFRVTQALDKSSNSKGTGLGLYISKSIIDLHHGRIWVESSLGKGSIFYFSLPISANFSREISSSFVTHPAIS